jgi:hypothetical protein
MFAKADLTKLSALLQVRWWDIKLKPLLTRTEENVTLSEQSTWVPLDAKDSRGKAAAVSADPLAFTDVAKRAARFNALLVESIDESITSLLSHQVADALFAHLKNRSVTRDQIFYQLDTIHSILERLFGPSTRIIEKDITKRLYLKLGIRFIDDPRMTLASHAIYLRKLQTSTNQG